MIIKKVRVLNFRSILDETLECDELTALVGPNGCGKSTFLRALELFYSVSPKIDAEDYYNRDTSVEIVVSLTFEALSDEAADIFSSYMEDCALTVELVLKWNNGKVSATYHGRSLQNDEFQKVRYGLTLKDRSATAKQEYEIIRAMPEYSGFSSWSNQSTVETTLKSWEASNPDKCTRQRDDGSFFGFNRSAQGYLGKFTQFLFIPAIRDASNDALERRGSVLTALMDMIVRSTLTNKMEIRNFREETQQKYEEIMNFENLAELQNLSSQLTNTLQTFAPNASVSLNWLPHEPIDIAMPKADVRLIEDQYPTSVDRTGHGLQRSFILTMLQHLAMAQSVKKDDQVEVVDDDRRLIDSREDQKITLPHLMMAIEEPELFQHPNSQRHLAKILFQLAHGAIPGVAGKTQIIYATHSPFFVGLDRFNQIRRLGKRKNGDDKPKVTKVTMVTLDKIAHELCKADSAEAGKYNGESLVHRLQAIMTPRLNEGFFADVVVLVEGEDDYAAIIGTARAMDLDLESDGISIIPVGGKRNIDRPALIFREFGIPIYLLWDSDGEKGETAGVCHACGRDLDRRPDPTDNHRLLRIMGKSEEDWPNHCDSNYCCFERDLESTLKEEIGEELFDELLSECQIKFGIPKKGHAIKNPNVISTIIEQAIKKGKTCETLKEVVLNVRKLNSMQQRYC